MQLVPLCGKENTDLGEHTVLSYIEVGRHSMGISQLCLFLFSNRVPWAIIIACNGVVAILCMIIRLYLARENHTRKNQVSSEPTYEDVYIVVRDENGSEVKRKVDKAFLDLTDRQNLEYHYVL